MTGRGIRRFRRGPGLALGALTLFASTQNASATYSVIGVDTESGEMGGFAVSCLGTEFSLSEVVNLRPGWGVVAAQGYFYEEGRDALLADFEGGKTPNEALAAALSPAVDPASASAGPNFRQYAALDSKGTLAQHSGDALDEVFGHREIRAGSFVFAAQGNLLSRAGVLETLESGLQGGGPSFSSRLLAALRAVPTSGGGDVRCAPLSGDSGYFVEVAPGRAVFEVERLSSDSEVALLLADAAETGLGALGAHDEAKEPQADSDSEPGAAPGESAGCAFRSPARVPPLDWLIIAGGLLGLVVRGRRRPPSDV